MSARGRDSAPLPQTLSVQRDTFAAIGYTYKPEPLTGAKFITVAFDISRSLQNIAKRAFDVDGNGVGVNLAGNLKTNNVNAHGTIPYPGWRLALALSTPI